MKLLSVSHCLQALDLAASVEPGKDVLTVESEIKFPSTGPSIFLDWFLDMMSTFKSYFWLKWHHQYLCSLRCFPHSGHTN